MLRNRGLGGHADPRRDGPAEVHALGGDYVEDGSGAEVHDDGRVAVQVLGGDRVGDAIRPHVPGVVVGNLQAGAERPGDRKRLDAEVIGSHLLEHAGQRRHHAAHRDLGHLLALHPMQLEEICQQQPVLVGRPPGIRSRPHGGDQPGIPEHADGDHGVADVQRQEHDPFPPPVGMFRTGGKPGTAVPTMLPCSGPDYIPLRESGANSASLFPDRHSPRYASMEYNHPQRAPRGHSL